MTDSAWKPKGSNMIRLGADEIFDRFLRETIDQKIREIDAAMAAPCPDPNDPLADAPTYSTGCDDLRLRERVLYSLPRRGAGGRSQGSGRRAPVLDSLNPESSSLTPRFLLRDLGGRYAVLTGGSIAGNPVAMVSRWVYDWRAATPCDLDAALAICRDLEQGEERYGIALSPVFDSVEQGDRGQGLGDRGQGSGEEGRGSYFFREPPVPSIFNETLSGRRSDPVPSGRCNRFPYQCPSCGEWETTFQTKATWWESFWNGWSAVMECPRCSERYASFHFLNP